MSFIGRETLLQTLTADWEAVRADGRARFVLVRGRRRVGKSRLVEELLRRTEAPSLYFTATRQALPRELDRFRRVFGAADLPAAAALGEVGFPTWEAALGVIGHGAVRERPPIVVLDEFPYLVKTSRPGGRSTTTDEDIEGVLQTIWDRTLSRLPLLLVVVGSDLAMMDTLAIHGRPLFERPTRELVVDPFTPFEVQGLTGLSASAALDAQLVVGGFPLLAGGWGRAHGVHDYLRRELANPNSPLVVSAERILDAEFPADLRARDVLETVGSGETTFTTIQRRSESMTAAALTNTLKTLQAKRVVVRDLPYGPGAPSEPRYRVTDPYLRFWLRFIGPRRAELDRGRSDVVCDEIEASWMSYRGPAIELVIRDAVARILPCRELPDARYVGGWWNRTNSVEVDLVGGDRTANPRRVAFIGSIKWRERSPFTATDRNALVAQLARVPGTDATTRLVAVSRSGVTADGLDLALGPEELVNAYAPNRK
jgi:uncharacterized protein